MQKTKLGISVGLLGAAVFFSGLFGGLWVAVLLGGYILLFEENEWLKRSAVKAVALMLSFSLLTALVSLLPDIIDLIRHIVNVFGGDFTVPIINKIVTVLHNVISLTRIILFLILGFKALRQGTIVLLVVDKLINKYMTGSSAHRDIVQNRKCPNCGAEITDNMAFCNICGTKL